MTNRTASCAFLVLTILSLTSHAQTGQLKACRFTSRSLVLKPGQKPFRLSGSLLTAGKHEYRVTVTTNLKVEIRLKTQSQLKLDIYSFKPPAKIKSSSDYWSDTLSKDNEYGLVVSNCYGTTNGTYQIEITLK